MAFPTGWGRRCALTIDHTKVPSTQTNIPILVGYNVVGSETNLPGECLTTGDPNAAQSNGADIRFTSDLAGSNGLHYEIVVFTQNATQASRHAEIWVSCSPSSSVDTTIYVWYKNPSATAPAANDATFGSQGVWDSNYVGVYHLPNGSSLTANDSTSNANTGTLVNTPTATTGKIDGGANFVAASSQYIDIGNGSSLQITGNLSIESWVKLATLPVALGSGYQVVAKDSNSGGRAYTFDINNIFNGSGIHARFYINGGGGADQVSGSTSISASTWYSLAGTYSTTGTLKIYLNGASDGSSTGGSSSIPSATANAKIGARTYAGFQEYMNGVIDEVRISNITRSADWITTSYNSQNGPSTFITTGTPVSVGAVSTILGISTLQGITSITF